MLFINFHKIKIFLIYLFLIFSAIIIIGPIINTLFELILFILFLLIIFRKDILKNRYFLFFIIILIFLIKTLMPNSQIMEGHNLILNKSDIKKIENSIDHSLINVLENKLYDYYYFYSNNLNLDNINIIKEKFEESKIDKPFAYSLDYQKNNNISFSRLTNKINFKNISTLHLGAINQNKYSFVNFYNFDRSQLPYFVKYELPLDFENSKLCWKGLVYFNYESNINNGLIENKEISCTVFSENNFPNYFVGFKFVEDLEMKLYKNNKLLIIDYVNIFIKIIFIVSLFLLTTLKYNRISLVFLLSAISTLLFITIFDLNFLMQMTISRGGADGLVLRSYAREISEFIQIGNYISAIIGGEQVFNFTPGIRYFFAIQSFVFGETMYGYIIVTIFLPVILYKFLNIFFSNKNSFLLFISFLFLPLFERYGFGYFNYIRELVRLHSEVLGLTLFLTGYYFNHISNENKNIMLTLISGLSFGTACLVRPDYSLACVFIILCISFRKLLLKDKSILLFIFGASIIFFMPIHNYIFGNEILLTTIASTYALRVHPLDYITFIKNMIMFNISDSINYKVINQIKGWNAISDFHRVIAILFIIYNVFKKIRFDTKIIIVCALLQQSLLFFYHNGGRQSYFAWFLVFISVLLIIKDLYYNKILRMLDKIKYYAK